MKKIFIIMVLCLLCVGCTKSPKEDSASVGKLEANKEFVYVNTNDALNLKNILQENGILEDYPNLFEFNSQFENQNIDNTKILMNEDISINLNSTDAIELQAKLKVGYENRKKTREKGSENIANRAVSFAWESMYLKSYEALEDQFSFSTYSSSMVVPGEWFYSINAYTLRISDGKLLSNEEVLATQNIKMNDLVSYIVKDFTDNKIDYFGEETKRELITEMPNQTDTQGTLYFRIKPENGILINKSEVTLILEQFSSLSGDFNSPITYTVKLEDIG